MLARRNMLARRVLRTKRLFGHGHWWQGPPNATPEFLVFANDPELGSVATTRGDITYLQAMAVGAETVEAIKRDEQEGRGDAELDRLMRSNPLLVTSRSLIKG
jgi:hypothetical protein